MSQIDSVLSAQWVICTSFKNSNAFFNNMPNSSSIGTVVFVWLIMVIDRSRTQTESNTVHSIKNYKKTVAKQNDQAKFDRFLLYSVAQ